MHNTVIWAQLPGINSVMMMQRKAVAETDMTTYTVDTIIAFGVELIHFVPKLNK